MALKDRIKQRMDDKRWTFTDLVRETQIAKGYLWEILSGTANRPSANSLFKIATALGTTVADLLEKDVSQPMPTLDSIPEPLRELMEEEQMTEEDVLMLAAIRYRNEQPKTKADWKFLYESIRRSMK